jgi:TRAP-type mannitol/chloroaromatic compound transport system permease small subunit
MVQQKKIKITKPLADDKVHYELPFLRENRVTRAIDRFVGVIGDVSSWIWLVLLAVIIGNVILRYVFNQGMIELEELQWYLYAAAWLIGLSYTFISDGHVRVDVVSETLSKRTKLWVEGIGLLVLFLPFVCFVLYHSWAFFHLSWVTGETSTSANGLSARWLVKGCLGFSFGLLLLVGFSRLIKVVNTLVFGQLNADVGSQR